MRVLVTGEAGFTARYVLPLLASSGHAVVALDADLTQAAAVEGRVAALFSDARSAPGAVLHLAGVSFAPDGVDAHVYAVNTVGTTALLVALSNAAHPPRRVVLASSAHVYGAREGRLDEASPLAPVTHYGASKLAMEYLARPFGDRLGIVIARPFNYTGVGQPARFLVPKLVEAFRVRQPELRLGNRHVARDFSDVRHIARAYLALLTAERPPAVVNLCSGRAVSIDALLTALEAETGHRPRIVTDPAFVRPDEVSRQWGDPALTERLTGSRAPPVEDVVRWMLRQPA
ncbi:NAD-dependent epimerase/dehydratase family protein [Pseudochelatococcus sp. B33]